MNLYISVPPVELAVSNNCVNIFGVVGVIDSTFV